MSDKIGEVAKTKQNQHIFLQDYDRTMILYNLAVDMSGYN